MVANSTATTCPARIRAWGSVAYCGRPATRTSRSGWMLWMVCRAMARASARPSSADAVMSVPPGTRVSSESGTRFMAGLPFGVVVGGGGCVSEAVLVEPDQDGVRDLGPAVVDGQGVAAVLELEQLGHRAGVAVLLEGRRGDRLGHGAVLAPHDQQQ